jgi:hypothetical protein
MQQESQYLGALDAADEFCLSGDRLTIAYGGQNNFNFERSSPLA